ncbi:thylakoid membrane protein TERC, chloroplastic-like [Cajanus cajan]|uniref:thylakoid membrane protein TERC, chloroplastic-like n=1 Tax=Cajanus cajan TaxID=3821 RepID=UPI0010FAFE0F|nr:thylakoid membrane protein TERC, chloroplastic-like [Cajanus cajan]
MRALQSPSHILWPPPPPPSAPAPATYSPSSPLSTFSHDVAPSARLRLPRRFRHRLCAAVGETTAKRTLCFVLRRYILEQSLSVDNLFGFVLIFNYFKVPVTYQNRVLSYGIAGAVVFRLALILIGTATLQRFEAVNLFLAAVLLYSSFKVRLDNFQYLNLAFEFINQAMCVTTHPRSSH